MGADGLQREYLLRRVSGTNCAQRPQPLNGEYGTVGLLDFHCSLSHGGQKYVSGYL